ncbi:hypothetical protein HCJ74_08360 [Listeria welshimeri]|nr:hypothetical protein [Listeria welshimeri]
MRLVITLMTKNKILEKNKNKINQIFTEKMASRSEIFEYVEDWNNIKDFGLFVTQRIIPDIKSYYNSGVCIAYLNFEYVSFGCMF